MTISLLKKDFCDVINAYRPKLPKKNKKHSRSTKPELRYGQHPELLTFISIESPDIKPAGGHIP